MEKYKSTYDRIIAEKEERGEIHILSQEKHIKIMQELSEGNDTFLLEERQRRIESERELKYINLGPF